MLVSKRKRYLSGADWVINTLDHLMKATTSAGNMSQIVLRLDSVVDGNAIRAALNRFIRQFPVLQGTVSRDFKLAPYWKIPSEAAGEPLFTVSALNDDGDDAVFSCLQENINTPFRSERDHLKFHLITGRSRSILAMAFDHRIFDARGAELFLNLFEQNLNSGSDSVSGDIAFASSAALTQWSRKFLAGKSVNRRIIALSKSTPEALPFPKNGNGTYQYRLLSFSAQESAVIYERAYGEAGYLMESPYLLSVIIQAMHELFADKQPTGASYLIPVTLDLRPGLDPLQEVFFNYVSYLFYQVPVGEVSDSRGLVALLKQQMYDQVKSGFPKDLAEASLLTRIAPLSVLGKVLHLPLHGKMATFAFSHLGKSAYQHSGIMGAKIMDIFHMPRVPVPPGLGFFSNFYNNRLNLVISWLDGLLNDQDVKVIENGMRKRFLAEKK